MSGPTLTGSDGGHRLTFARQVAIVTGAGRGLGRIYALELARRGARVVICDVGGTEPGEAPWADAVVREITGSGGTAVASYDSVATAAGGEAIVRTALDAFGTIDILINNAGFMRPGTLGELTARQIEDVAAVHLFAGFHVTQPAGKVMAAKGYGRVILTSSHSIFGHESNSNYAAAKAGLLGLGRVLALEGAGHGIRVNCVLPSATSQISINAENPAAGQSRVTRATRALSSRRTAESVAPMITLLASDRCPVTGEAFSCVAGRFARVFLGVTDGWIAPSVHDLTAEELAAHLDEIRDLRRFDVPASMAEVFEHVVRRLSDGSARISS
jgi:NAD(P)-dependent dehydrogenase (short-subunit alcohol dehydrogenase family)